MSSLINSILNLIFPPRCEVCRTTGEDALCRDCFEQIKFMRPQLGVYSVSVYDGVLRDAIHRFKFKKRKKLAEPLGILMVKYLSQTHAFDMKEIDAIVPVPLHQRRLRERGFNQSRLLADVLGRYFGVKVAEAIARKKDTKANFDLARNERFQNIAGAFKLVDLGPVYNKRILLIDDIYTTGATIAECSKTLQSGGAKRVEVATLSRAVD